MTNWTEEDLAAFIAQGGWIEEMGHYLAEGGQLADEPTAQNAQAQAVRSQGGRRARKAGKAWEEALEAYHARLSAQGLAAMHKTGPMVEYMKVRGKVGPMVTGPGPADYVGVLADGRFIGFEAKTTSDPSGYTLPAKSLHQLVWLNEIRQISAGRAVTFYLVRYRTGDETRLHRIEDILPGKRLRRPEGILVPDGISWIDHI